MAESQEFQSFKTDFEIYDETIERVRKIKNDEDDNWKKFANGENLKLFYKQEPGNSLYSFYGEKVIDAPIFNVLSILAEAQTYKDWVPFTYKSEILYETSNFRKLAEFGIKMPWPFGNRSVYISVSAIPVKGEQSMVITMKSIKGSEWIFGKEVKKDQSTVEVDVQYCSAYIEQIEENK